MKTCGDNFTACQNLLHHNFAPSRFVIVFQWSSKIYMFSSDRLNRIGDLETNSCPWDCHLYFWWLFCLQASVGLLISLLLLVDLSLTLLMLLQFYSISLGAMLGILLVLPFASVIPSAAGLNALFSHGPRRSAALARIYALWNITSFVNLVSCPILSLFFICCL